MFEKRESGMHTWETSDRKILDSLFAKPHGFTTKKMHNSDLRIEHMQVACYAFEYSPITVKAELL